MADKIGGLPGRINTQQVKGPTQQQGVKSLKGGYDNLNLNTLGPAQNPEAVRSGRAIALTAPEGETSSDEASEGAQLMRGLIQPGDGGRGFCFDFTPGGLTNYANSQSTMFAELEGYKVQDNLNVGQDSITPEKREELRRLSQKYNDRLTALGDEGRHDQLSSMASQMTSSMDQTFQQNNTQVNASGMERFFKFDPSVQPQDNFLAKLGGYISLMRGEAPDGAFGPRATLQLEKFINLTGDLSTNRAGSDGLAKAKLHQTITGGKAGGSPGGGSTPPNLF